jgi:hypothetical protein
MYKREHIFSPPSALPAADDVIQMDQRRSATTRKIGGERKTFIVMS